MLKVVYDYQIFALQAYGGVPRYFTELSKSLLETGSVQPTIIAPLHINAYLSELESELVWGLRRRSARRSKKLERALNRFAFFLAKNALRPDIIHETYYYGRLARHRSAPVITTIHDMIHERFAKQFSERDQTTERKRRCVESADHVICVSHNTKRDLVDLFGVADEKISVVHHGVRPLLPTTLQGCAVSESGGSSGPPFILYVGQRHGYKNFGTLVKAMADLRGPAAEFRLVCFGGGNFTRAEEDAFATAGIAKHRIVQVSGDDSALADRYRNAVCMVYPSLYEGFGMPILEAMSLGCPVLCSDSSAMPEVGGDAVLYFDPLHVDSLHQALVDVAESQELRSRLSAKGKARSAQFTWQSCAENTLSVYRKVV